MRRARRVVITTVIAAAAVLARRGIAYAHAMLVSAEPAADTVVATSPTRIRLVFSEQIEPSLATMLLVHGDGRLERLSVAGDPHDVDAIMASVGSLAPGGYRVSWRVVSADGHPVGGSLVFWVGSRTGTVPPDVATEQGASSTTWGPTVKGAPAIPALLRGLAVGSAMALAGMLLLFSRARDNVAGATGRAKSLMRVLAVATPILFLLHFTAWAINASSSHHITSDMLGDAIASGVGRLELWRLALAILAAWALLLARRPSLALFFALILVTLSGGTGHSAAIRPTAAMPAKALHLVAGSVWLGGLLWLLTIDRGEMAFFRREALRVSSLAFWSVIAVTASGLLMALFFLPSLRDLVRSAYGAVVLAKILGLIALTAFGAYHRSRVLPSLGSAARPADDFVVTLGREIAVMVVVILLGGLLAYLPPPRPVTVRHSPAHTSVE